MKHNLPEHERPFRGTSQILTYTPTVDNTCQSSVEHTHTHTHTQNMKKGHSATVLRAGVLETC